MPGGDVMDLQTFLEDFMNLDDLKLLVRDASELFRCPAMVVDVAFHAIAWHAPAGFDDAPFTSSIERGSLTYETGSLLVGSDTQARFVTLADSPYRRRFSLLITGAILGLCAGHSPALMAENFVKIVTTPATMKTIAVVIQVGILSALMKHYGILAKLVDAFKQIFSSAKAVIMILPAAIGILSVPGGAGISSPFVDELGASMDLPVPKRAAVNLTFRHMAYFLFPTSTPIILMSNIAPQISTYRLIAMNVAFIFCMEPIFLHLPLTPLRVMVPLFTVLKQ